MPALLFADKSGVHGAFTDYRHTSRLSIFEDWYQVRPCGRLVGSGSVVWLIERKKAPGMSWSFFLIRA
jgi:hypothetical protein